MSLGQQLQSFFTYDTILSRIAVFIIIMIVFVVLLHVGFGIISLLTKPSSSP